MKHKIITVAPESWRIREIAKECNASDNTTRQAKQLRSTNGVQADPPAKAGRNLPDSIAAKVNEFYQADDISKIMSGRKDTWSTKVGGKRIKMQKRHLLTDKTKDN